MICIMIGPPGAGKGTQCDMLVEKEGFRKVSTGDALRKHIKGKTEIGLKAAEVVARGDLVSDDILLEIIKAELGNDSDEKILLDGYPRNVDQAKTLEKLELKNKIIAAIHLDVDSQELVARLSGRRVCSQCGASFHVDSNPSSKGSMCDKCGGSLTQRPDDNPEKVTNRLSVYEKSTKPVLDFYKEQGLYRKVQGSGELADVYSRIESVIHSLT